MKEKEKEYKFECNGTEWSIKKVSEAEINNEMKNEGTLGVTIYRSQEILILESQENATKTLVHELAHVWLYEYGHNQADRKFDNEDVCEIIASSLSFIAYTITNFKEWEFKNK